MAIKNAGQVSDDLRALRLALARDLELRGGDLRDALRRVLHRHYVEAGRNLALRLAGRHDHQSWRDARAQWNDLADRYAPLLAFQPVLDERTGAVDFKAAVGGERKETGSYYTPESLVDCLLDSALDPVLAEACSKPDPEAAILGLAVCDPACGSGQFLAGAARRLGIRLAQVRTNRSDPPPAAVRAATADVIGSCLYGVDADATAAAICRTALWLLAADPDLPAATLEGRIRVGNSLLGATRALLAAGIPDAAFRPLAGDDAAVCREWRDELGAAAHRTAMPAREAADAWCAAYFWPKTGTSPSLARDRGAIAAIARRYGFFHWHLEFPAVLGRGGFDVVLGNPPWERVKLQDKEWFAVRHPGVAGARNAARRRERIAALATLNPRLWADFQEAHRGAEAESLFIRTSGRFPRCGRGDVNTFAVFAELICDLLAPTGRAGFVVPSGLATDHTHRDFFFGLLRDGLLASFLDFENRRGLFPAVDNRVKFALVTLTGRERPVRATQAQFFAHDAVDLRDPEHRLTLRPDDIALINPNSRTCPIFRTGREADLVKAIYRRVGVLVRESPPDNPWRASFCRMFDMANDSGLFSSSPGPGRLPLYEAKLLHQFDHRWATFEADGLRLATAAEKGDPAFRIRPRYWVARAEVAARLGAEPGWLLAFRDIARSTDERTAMAALLPLAAVSHHAPLLRPTGVSARHAACLLANLNSFVLDFVARTKVGGTHLTFFIVKQLPVLPPAAYDGPRPWTAGKSLGDWIADRVLALVYTTAELAPFARACGFSGPPFSWDPERRFAYRCELDAAFARLYGLDRTELRDVLETFPIVRRKDLAAHGTPRARDAILADYERFGSG